MTKREIATYFFVLGAFSVLFFFVVNIFVNLRNSKNMPETMTLPEDLNVSQKKNFQEVASSSKSDLKQISSQVSASSVALNEIEAEIEKLRAGIAAFGARKSDEELPVIKSGEIYAKALQALVNILCQDSNRGFYIFGSGAIVNPQGYVLTNAHLAEYFKTPGVSCSLRRGSPARFFSRADVVYLPNQDSKIGTSTISANDIAILKIVDSRESPDDAGGYEYFEFDPNASAEIGQNFYYLGYPTEFLGAQTALSNSAILFSIGVVDGFVSIDENLNTAEGAYLKGEISAQHGSSGGIFLDMKSGKISGLFVGLTDAKNTSLRKQFIFLSSYIDEIVKKDKGMGLAEYLATNP